MSRHLFKNLFNLKSYKLASPICTASRILNKDSSFLNKNSNESNGQKRFQSNEAQSIIPEPEKLKFKPKAPPSSFICAENNPVRFNF